MNLLIKNARVIDPASGFDTITDILCRDGRIERIGSSITVGEGCTVSDTTVLDAAGLAAAPGLVDMHCHLRDPGLEYKEDIRSGTHSAAAGGITSVACMPNTLPVCDSVETIRYIRKKAAEVSPIRVYPIGAVTLGEKGAQPAPYAALREAGAVAFSDDGMPVKDAPRMREAMLEARRLGTVVISHCEDFDFDQARAAAGDSGLNGEDRGLPGCRVPIETDEESMAARDIALSLQTGAPVHIAHVSTKNTIALVRYAKSAGLPVTCETCPHYFLLDSGIIAAKGTLAKMNPPLRTASDRDAVIDGLCDGTIDAIVTDHAPHAAEEKARPFESAPNGIVGFETMLAGSLTALYHTGRMTLPDVLRRLTCTPSDILGIDAGRIQTGAIADLVLFAPDEEWTPDPTLFLSKSKNSPFGGMRLKGRVKYTISAGRVVYGGGKIHFEEASHVD